MISEVTVHCFPCTVFVLDPLMSLLEEGRVSNSRCASVKCVRGEKLVYHQILITDIERNVC